MKSVTQQIFELQNDIKEIRNEINIDFYYLNIKNKINYYFSNQFEDPLISNKKKQINLENSKNIHFKHWNYQNNINNQNSFSTENSNQIKNNSVYEEDVYDSYSNIDLQNIIEDLQYHPKKIENNDYNQLLFYNQRIKKFLEEEELEE